MKTFAFILLCCLTSLAAKHSREPVNGVGSLDVYGDGDRIHLLIVQDNQLQYLRSTDAGAHFAAPVQLGINQPPTIAHRGMDAQIAAAGENLVAVWPTAGTDKMGRGPMATAISADRGRTWSAGPNPADDGLTIGHSFIALTADARGAFHLVWLDSRAGKDKGLRYSQSTDGGATWSANATIDPSTCECCWNTITATPAGNIAVLYRRKDPRDMGFVQSADSGKTWSQPVTVGAFNWTINACPHIGGALAFGKSVHAFVWTAKDNDAHGVYLLNSTDAGATWSAPKRIGSPDGSRPDLAQGANGNLLATWDDYVGGQQSIFTATSTDDGATWSAPARLSESDASATHPRVIWTSRGPRIFWTQQRPNQPVEWLSAIR